MIFYSSSLSRIKITWRECTKNRKNKPFQCCCFFSIRKNVLHMQSAFTERLNSFGNDHTASIYWQIKNQTTLFTMITIISHLHIISFWFEEMIQQIPMFRSPELLLFVRISSYRLNLLFVVLLLVFILVEKSHNTTITLS